MKLSEFPRPSNDTARGVHWHGIPYHYPLKDWPYWREQLLAMNIKWVKFLDDTGGSGLPLAMRLVDIGIMPVVRLYRNQQNPGTIGDRGATAVREYVDIGAPYFESNNEPDLALEWRGGKRPENWLEIIIRDFIQDADVILELGGYPAVPAFGVGTSANPFAEIVRQGRKDILNNGAWSAIHNYCLGRPLEYPRDLVNTCGASLTQKQWETDGGMWAYEMPVEKVNEAREKYANPDASILTDATCFRAYEQVNTYIHAACGHSIPIMMTEGGYNVGQQAPYDARYAKPTPQRAGELNMAMFKFASGETKTLDKRAPNYLFALMPWLIAARRMGWYADPAENQGPWFTDKYNEEWGLSGELPLVQILKDDPGTPRCSGPVPEPWKVKRSSDLLGCKWDERLDYIGVKYLPCLEENENCWKLVSAKWKDQWEAGGLPAIYVKALDEKGRPIENAEFIVSHGNDKRFIQTKGEIDNYWGNFGIHAVLGTYSAQMNNTSDIVARMGVGAEYPPEHPWAATQFWLTFRLKKPEIRPVRTDFSDPYWRGR